MAILLETKKLSKEYHNVKAVDSFSISMEEGHIYGIIGPNGAGKKESRSVFTGNEAEAGDSGSIDYRVGSAGIGRAHERRGTGGHCGTAAYSEKTL